MKEEDCKHPNKEVMRSWACITVTYEYRCPDCGKEWAESDDY